MDEHSPAGVTRRALFRRGAVAGSALALGSALPVRAALRAADAPLDPVLRLARVWPDPRAPEGLDDTHRVFDDGSFEVVLWPGDLERLRTSGARFAVTVPDLVARDAARPVTARLASLRPQPGERTDYRRLADVEADLRELADRYPTTSRLFELPFVTGEGRRVLGLEIARDVHAVDGRPTFHVDGVHHAREWPAVEMAIMWAYDLLTNDGVDPRVTTVLDHVRTTVVPVVNPDGFHHSRETAVGQGAEGVALGGRGQYWRKNRRGFTPAPPGEGLGVVEGQTGGRYPEPARGTDAYGVDPNRNYAYTWGRPGSSSSDVHSQSHRGDAPFSEPESRNIAWLSTTRHVTGTISHHTFANEIIWPWADQLGPAPDAALFTALGSAMAVHNGYRARKFTTSEGTTPDHFYGSVSAMAFLFEHGTTEFHPPYAGYVPAAYAKNREAFLLLTEELCLLPELRAPRTGLPAGLLTAAGGRRLHHAVLRGRVVDGAGAPVVAELVTRKRYRSPLWKGGDGSAPLGRRDHEEVFEARTRTADDGSFVWHLNPSTRPHVVVAGGTESYELTVLADEGGTARRLTLRRGDDLDLGDLKVV